jgi:hypothetical protein
MEHRLTALETRLDTVLPTLATKADVEGVRADISRWMLATVVTIIGTMLAAIFGLSQVFKGAQSGAQQPIIINIPAPAAGAAPTSNAAQPKQ